MTRDYQIVELLSKSLLGVTLVYNYQLYWEIISSQSLTSWWEKQKQYCYVEFQKIVVLHIFE